jgi:AcrR family transcriptional regulator
MMKNVLSKVNNMTSGRANQKHRTRNDLLEAAAVLMRQGQVPSLEDVAAAAHVSRATAYRYFPTQEHVMAGTLVLQANLEGEARLETIMQAADPATRLDGVVRVFHERFSTHEVAYRALLRILLQPIDQDESGEQPKVRASRHVHWLDRALAPLKPDLDEEQYERLFAAIFSATSLEAYLALRDVCLQDAATAGTTMCWTAQSILKAVLAEKPKSQQ